MYYSRVNQVSNSYFSNNYSSDYSSTVTNSVQDGPKPKAKAYINPQIMNYEYFKRSLSSPSFPSTNKIHVNPNFKGNGYNDAHVRNAHMLHSLAITTPSEVQQGSSTLTNVVEGGRNDIGKVSTVSSNESVFSENILNKSKYKKVNYVSEKSENKYTWSKDNQKNKYCLNKKAQLSTNVLIGRKDNDWSSSLKPKTIIQPSSSYKYTAPKKIFKVINSSTTCVKKSSTYFSKTKIINKSKTKLINNISPKMKLNIKAKTTQTPVKRNCVASKFVYISNKKSPAIKLASLVRNKYKYCKPAKHLRNLKYKIDKRKKVPESLKKRPSEISDIGKLFPKNYYVKRKLGFSNSYVSNHYGLNLTSRKTHSWRRDQKSDLISQRKRNLYPNKRVVKIGGILYKSTTNKLTLANKKENVASKKIITKGKGKKNYTVYVRGEKFLLDKNGKTLRRQVSHTEKDKTYLTALKRIYIGGVTYVQKSDNILIRTNVHQARNLVNQAKQKSIAVLSNLKKRSSLPCMIFHKFGKCNRHDKGLCIYKHDPKNVAICKKFLKGNCDNKNCLLSHEAIQEKMATCHFYLNGFCTRENCPFLHVKLSKNAAICEKFLQGFCDLGKNCSKRHLYQCPEFDKFGTCSLGSKCHYPHKTDDKSKKLVKNQTENKSNDENETLKYYTKPINLVPKKKEGKVPSSIRKDNQNKRELNKVKKIKRKASTPTTDSTAACDRTDSTIECFPKRVKLDQLPGFIPLKSDEK